MALIVKDRIKETTTTTSTGTVTLAGAEAGFQAFSVVGDANTTYYAIVSGNNWEVGLGTYTLSGTTLSRDTVLESSNSGSKITLAGTSDVFCTYPAEKSVLTDAIGTAAALDTGISNTNVPKFTSGVADDDFLRVDGTAIEGRSASEVLSDIGGITASSTDTLTNKSIVATQLTGTVPTARLGSGTASSSVFLSGASTWIAAGGGATLVASDTSLSGTTVAFTSLDLSSYKILIISSSNWGHDGGSNTNKIQILPNGGSNSLLGGDAVSSSSTPGNQYTTFDLNTGLYWTWTRNAMSAGVVAPIALPATGLQMGYNNGVLTTATSLTFSLDTGDDFNAGKMYIYGL